MTMNDNWGWAKFDDNWKTVEQLVLLLVETASKGGNLLLNVGPMGDGRFPQQSIDSLEGIGQWMRVNGSAIHGTTASPFAESLYRVTSGPDRLNVFIDEWRPGEFLLPGLRTLPRHAFLLGDPAGGAVGTRLMSEGLAVSLPDREPPGLCPVVRLEFAGPPVVDPAGSTR